ncbi:MAG: hypothetical protein ACOH2Q_24990 [Rhodococcus sp. (in: high G+C Gram-positive bacteria)]
MAGSQAVADTETWNAYLVSVSRVGQGAAGESVRVCSRRGRLKHRAHAGAVGVAVACKTSAAGAWLIALQATSIDLTAAIALLLVTMMRTLDATTAVYMAAERPIEPRSWGRTLRVAAATCTTGWRTR